jgi:hypothetical protein
MVIVRVSHLRVVDWMVERREKSALAPKFGGFEFG